MMRISPTPNTTAEAKNDTIAIAVKLHAHNHPLDAIPHCTRRPILVNLSRWGIIAVEIAGLVVVSIIRGGI